MRHLFDSSRLTEIVDIGANAIEDAPPYEAFLKTGRCRLTGFEPHPEAFAALKPGPNERFFPQAVGDGARHTLHICNWSTMTSLFEPDPVRLAFFEPLARCGQVVDRMPIDTVRLDDIDAIETIDLLKIDTQGSELAIFQNGRARLSSTVAVQTEVNWFPFYKNQPSYGEVDAELRAQGFIAYAPLFTRHFVMEASDPSYRNNNLSHQVVDQDVLYLRDWARPDGLDDDQLIQMALICHHIYAAHDIALHCLARLEHRGAIPAGSLLACVGGQAVP